MTLAQLKALLEQSTFPVTYSHFTATENNPIPEPPFICYLEAYSSNFMADSKVYQKIKNVQIELYTKLKDTSAENKLETILDTNNIPYDSTENFIESEKLFQKIYEVRLI
jgi:hypothetical protein